MNAVSSRSHSIFEIKVSQYLPGAAKQKKLPKPKASAKIVLIDLAGSERAKDTGDAAVATGTFINKSLTVLGRCITALVKEVGPES